jgi:hypothetical protein
MAAQISHILAGEEAAGRVSGTADMFALGDAADSFRLGCQGPDIFYHNRRTMPSGLHYGALAHRRRFGSLVAGAAASLPMIERGGESPSGAYILGLATHAAIDRATHPFVIYFSGWVDPSDPGTARLRGCHPFLERLLDIGLLERRLGISPREYAPAARLGAGADGEADGRLVGLWSAGLRAAYPRAAGADPSLELRIANALADARNFYAITAPAAAALGRDDRLLSLGKDEGRRLISLVYPERIPEGLDPMNLAGVEWEHPSGDGRRSRASYPDLIDEGSDEAARSIDLVLEYWRGRLSASALALELGEGGLALRDAGGEALPPRISRPLALPEAIEAELLERIGRLRAGPSDPVYDPQVDLSSPGR